MAGLVLGRSCRRGTDCSDCGPRLTPTAAAAAAPTSSPTLLLAGVLVGLVAAMVVWQRRRALELWALELEPELDPSSPLPPAGWTPSDAFSRLRRHVAYFPSGLRQLLLGGRGDGGPGSPPLLSQEWSEDGAPTPGVIRNRVQAAARLAALEGQRGELRRQLEAHATPRGDGGVRVPAVAEAEERVRKLREQRRLAADGSNRRSGFFGRGSRRQSGGETALEAQRREAELAEAERLLAAASAAAEAERKVSQDNLRRALWEIDLEASQIRARMGLDGGGDAHDTTRAGVSPLSLL